jgi:RsiW-degrading membrane proteinase PrsW (M82 family)
MTAIDTPPASPSAPAPVVPGGPPAGFYVVPDVHHHPVERRWDGDVWTDDERPAPADAELPRHRRHPLAFLRTPGWILALVYVATTIACVALVAEDPHATRPSGIVWALPPLAFASSITVMVGAGLYFQRRLRFEQVGERGAAVAWGVVAGAVGVGVALLGEVALPTALGGDPDGWGWVWIAGPAEETGKLLVPVVLWYLGRFRLPRQGFLLVVSSAATFGVIEAARYGLSPDKFSWNRGGGEILHVLLTGFVAAVAWRAAWRRPGWFTAAGVAAYLVAVALHSLNDAAVLDRGGPKAFSLATAVVVVVLYVLLKRSARQMVPPDNVDAVSPRWRPIASALPDAGRASAGA